jgi:hypothetical protein
MCMTVASWKMLLEDESLVRTPALTRNCDCSSVVRAVRHLLQARVGWVYALNFKKEFSTVDRLDKRGAPDLAKQSPSMMGLCLSRCRQENHHQCYCRGIHSRPRPCHWYCLRRPMAMDRTHSHSTRPTFGGPQWADGRNTYMRQRNPPQCVGACWRGYHKGCPRHRSTRCPPNAIAPSFANTETSPGHSPGGDCTSKTIVTIAPNFPVYLESRRRVHCTIRPALATPRGFRSEREYCG